MSDSEHSSAAKQSGGPIVITPQTVLKVLGVAGALIGTVYGFNSFLDTKIEAKMSDPVFLMELARSQRPSMVFDENGTVLSDFGAMRLLRDFDVALTEDKKAWLVKLTPLEFLGVEPLVESLDNDAVIKARRGKGLEWLIEIHPLSSLLLAESPEPGPLRFRLEILR